MKYFLYFTTDKNIPVIIGTLSDLSFPLKIESYTDPNSNPIIINKLLSTLKVQRYILQNLDNIVNNTIYNIHKSKLKIKSI